MRIKGDFVTNSSSTAYIMGFNEQQYEEFEKFLKMFNKGPFYIIQDPTEEQIVKRVGENPDIIEDFYFERDELEKEIIIFDVSDELGSGLMENTIFSNNIIGRSEN